MVTSPFSNVFLTDLSPGAGLVLIGFRGSAFGRPKCGCIEDLFESYLQDEGGAVLTEIDKFAHLLRTKGQRKIRIRLPLYQTL